MKTRLLSQDYRSIYRVKKALLQQEHLKKAEKKTAKSNMANVNRLIPRANHPMQLTA